MLESNNMETSSSSSKPIKIKDTENNIAKTWITGQNSCTLIISKRLAQKYGLTEPSHVLLQGTTDGILIRKLEIQNGSGQE